MLPLALPGPVVGLVEPLEMFSFCLAAYGCPALALAQAPGLGPNVRSLKSGRLGKQ